MDLEDESALNRPTIKGEEKKCMSMMPFYEYVFLEYSLMAELLLFQQQSLTGIYIAPSSPSPLVWNGVMFIRQGTYMGGQFRFKLIIPDDFPDDGPPSVIFTPPVFHPLIHPTTGELDVQRAFHPWKKAIHHLWNLVAYAKRSFSNIELTKPLNKEAADIFQNDSELFKVKVKESLNLCAAEFLRDQDPENSLSFRFTEMNSESMLNIKKQITEFKESRQIDNSDGKNDIRSLGLSWMSARIKH